MKFYAIYRLKGSMAHWFGGFISADTRVSSSVSIKWNDDQPLLLSSKRGAEASLADVLSQTPPSQHKYIHIKSLTEGTYKPSPAKKPFVHVWSNGEPRPKVIANVPPAPRRDPNRRKASIP